MSEDIGPTREELLRELRELRTRLRGTAGGPNGNGHGGASKGAPPSGPPGSGDPRWENWVNETLVRIGAVLSQDLEIETIVQRLTDEATRLCRAQFGSFFYKSTNERGEDLMLYTLSGASREAFSRFPMPRSTAVFAPTLEGAAVVRSDDITRDARYGKNAPHRGMPEGHLPVRSYLAMPVVSRSGEILGALFFGHAEASVFTERDEQLLAAIAPQAAIAIDNARLYKALEHQSKISRAITDNATAALFMMDERQHCTFMNPAAVAMTGYSPEETSGRPLHDVIHHHHPDGRPYPMAECPIDRALPEKNQTRGEDVFIRKDGSFFPVAFTASPILEDGRPVGTVIEVRDITEEKRAEDALKMQALVLQSMAEGVSLSDERGVIRYTNAAEDAMFGYARGELVGKHVSVQNAYPPEENARVVGDIIAEVRARGVWTGELRNVKKDGTPFTTRAQITALDLSGEPHWVCVQSDVTADRRAREAASLLAEASTILVSSLEYRETLPRVAERAASVFDGFCGVLLGEDEYRLELVAAAHEERERAEVLRALDHVRGAGASCRGSLRHLAAKVLASAEPELVPVLPASAPPDLLEELGATSWICVPLVVQGQAFGALALAATTGARRYDEADLALAQELARRVAVAIDNARLFEMAQKERLRAEEANRAKDLFLSTLSHELRTPLTAILGWTRMLRTGSLSEEKRERALETIDRNARTQVALIEDILDLGRIVTGKLRLDFEPVQIAHVASAALDTVRPAAEAKGVRLQAVLDPDAGVVMGDPNRLQQVAWNLLSNAIKFTPRGGRVHVRLRREASHVELVVADTGQGIAPEFLPHVFERFRQADASTTRTHGGLGLGLAIVRHLVELHGGSVRVESDGEGRGASFAIRIPIAPLRSTSFASQPELALAVKPSAELDCPPKLDGLRILVVDDEPDARDLLAGVLEHCGAHVFTARSAGEAFEALTTRRPDVLVSDIGMPGEDGFALIKKVRALSADAGGRTPAVALTAYARMEDRTRAIVAGFNHHVSKPVEPQELLVVIASLTGKLS